MQQNLTKRLSSKISDTENSLQEAIEESYMEYNLPLKKKLTVS